MSMELDSNLLGVIRPAPESCDERGKRLKMESESESESESEKELESDSESEEEEFPDWDYRTKPFEDLVIEDFSSRYDDYPRPYTFGCSRFFYRNKAQIKKDEEEEKALAEYLEDYAKITSPFDAIPVPPLVARRCGNNFPKPVTITDDYATLLTRLSKLALIKYNDENNQGSNYQFHCLVKACRRPMPLTTYYITFQATTIDAATNVDPFNLTTFQAHVWNQPASKGPPVVHSCSIKPN